MPELADVLSVMENKHTQYNKDINTAWAITATQRGVQQPTELWGSVSDQILCSLTDSQEAAEQGREITTGQHI